MSDSNSGPLSRYDRWFWSICTEFNAGALVYYVVTGGSRWGIALCGFVAIVGILLLRYDWLLRHPDEEAISAPTRGTQ